MSGYTPTTEEVRDDWECCIFEGSGTSEAREDAAFDRDRRVAQFDRWLAQGKREVAAEAEAALLLELLPVLEEAVSNAYLCKADRGVGDEWDDDIARAEAARDRAAAYRRNEGEQNG